MRGVQHKIIEAFLDWLWEHDYRITKVGSRPLKQLSKEEALEAYGRES